MATKIKKTDKAPAKTSRDKVRAHRKRLRARGLRPIQIWVPDVNSPAFIKEARRQSRMVARSAGEKDNIAFVESLMDWDSFPEWNER